MELSSSNHIRRPISNFSQNLAFSEIYSFFCEVNRKIGFLLFHAIFCEIVPHSNNIGRFHAIGPNLEIHREFQYEIFIVRTIEIFN